MKVLISGRAEEDLARIYAYIAVRNPDAAERFKVETEKALELLCLPLSVGS
jgi:plasmid stabilization system protein ParE